MKKRFLAISLLCFFIIKGLSQPIQYSNNKLSNSEYSYKIIGEVNNNIVVWATDLIKQRAATIFVYDKSMHLINSINTNIEQAEPAAGAHFFITGNTFQVLYPCKTKNIFLLKLASFDEKGNMLYERIIDSIENPNTLNNKNVYYQVLQSKQHKVACFIKMLSDKQHHVLKFSFSFINETALPARTFSIPFNEDLEDITDMLVDDDKNILLLKQRKLDTAVELTLVKLDFTGNLVLGSNKTVSNYFVKPNSMHIVENTAGYTVFGLLKKDDRQYNTLNKQEGLYVWQTSNDLLDIASDTILNKGTNKDVAMYAACISGNTAFSNLFVIWNAFENIGTSSKPRWAYTAQDNSFQSYEKGNSSNLTYNNLSLIYYDEKSLMKKAPDDINLVKENDKYQPDKLQLMKIDSRNKIVWQTAIIDSVDNITIANLNNAKIITGNRSLHIVCEIIIKGQPRSLNHIMVQPNGTITETLLTNWDKQYKYNLDASVFTGKKELIIPAYKGNKIVFANIKLE
jgi:hypothetical protein